MEEVKCFEKEEFGSVRTIEADGKILFCGSDVAKCLGYAKPNNAVHQHCKGDTLKHSIIDNLGRTQEAIFISEGNVYRLIAHSKLPAAEKFESWIFDEVVPSVIHTGSYSIKPMTMDDCMKIIAQSSAQISSAISALSVQTQTNTVQLQNNTSRIEQLEKKFEEKTKDVAPDLPPRERIVALIRNQASKTKEDFNELYRKLYSDYSLRTHTNPSLKAKKGGMTTIAFIEKEGDIGLLLSIAEKLFGFGA